MNSINSQENNNSNTVLVLHKGSFGAFSCVEDNVNLQSGENNELSSVSNHGTEFFSKLSNPLEIENERKVSSTMMVIRGFC